MRLPVRLQGFGEERVLARVVPTKRSAKTKSAKTKTATSVEGSRRQDATNSTLLDAPARPGITVQRARRPEATQEFRGAH